MSSLLMHVCLSVSLWNSVFSLPPHVLSLCLISHIALSSVRAHSHCCLIVLSIISLSYVSLSLSLCCLPHLSFFSPRRTERWISASADIWKKGCFLGMVCEWKVWFGLSVGLEISLNRIQEMRLRYSKSNKELKARGRVHGREDSPFTNILHRVNRTETKEKTDTLPKWRWDQVCDHKIWNLCSGQGLGKTKGMFKKSWEKGSDLCPRNSNIVRVLLGVFPHNHHLARWGR